MNNFYNFIMTVPDSDVVITASLVDWEIVSDDPNLSEDILCRYKDYITTWESISKFRNLSERCLIECHDYVYWEYVAIPSIHAPDNNFTTAFDTLTDYIHFRNFELELVSPDRGQLSEYIIRRFSDEVDWDIISVYSNLSDAFFRDFADQLNWNTISFLRSLPTRLWIEFYDRLIWREMCYSRMSEEYIREFAPIMNMREVGKYQWIPQDIIREYANSFDWNHLCQSRDQLSEGLMREFDHLLDYRAISTSQALSEEFIRDYRHVLYWKWISKFQTLSNDFMREMGRFISWEDIDFFQKLSFCHYIRKCHGKQMFAKSHRTLQIPPDVLFHIFSYI